VGTLYSRLLAWKRKAEKGIWPGSTCGSKGLRRRTSNVDGYCPGCRIWV